MQAARSRALLAASLLTHDSCSATFSPRIFEQKRDCSQSTTQLALGKKGMNIALHIRLDPLMGATVRSSKYPC